MAHFGHTLIFGCGLDITGSWTKYQLYTGIKKHCTFWKYEYAYLLKTQIYEDRNVKILYNKYINSANIFPIQNHEYA